MILSGIDEIGLILDRFLALFRKIDQFRFEVIKVFLIILFEFLRLSFGQFDFRDDLPEAFFIIVQGAVIGLDHGLGRSGRIGKDKFFGVRFGSRCSL